MKTQPVVQLQTFLIVARRGSFSGAARELGITTSAVSQAVKALEEHLGVVLLTRTTRSVALTDAGRRLVERTAPALGEVNDAMKEVRAAPGEVVGRVRLTVPRAALAPVVRPVLRVFRDRYPSVEVEIVIEERFVDLVSEGYDAGIRLTEAIERDMVQLRLTAPFRFIVVGAPSYLEGRALPKRPEDLLQHACIGVLQASGTVYAWELERAKRTVRVPVRGGILTNDEDFRMALAEDGLGLTYAREPVVEDALQAGRLVRVLPSYAAHVPGFFLYYPSRAQRSPALRAFVETARDVLRIGAGERPQEPVRAS